MDKIMKDKDIEKKEKETEEISNKIKNLEKELFDQLNENDVVVSGHYSYYGKYGQIERWIDPYIRSKGGMTERNDERHRLWVNKYIDYFISKRHEIYKEHFKEVDIGNSICDVLVNIKHSTKIIDKVCGEVQLSPISFKELESRTFEYIDNGYKVEWVLPIVGEAYKQRVFWRLHNKLKNRNFHVFYKYIEDIACKSFLFEVSDDW